jgi:hypothetical protein
LDLTVALSISSTADCIDFIKKDDASLLGSGKLEQLTNHASSFTYIALNKLTADNSDEACIRSVGDCSRAQRFTSSWWTIKQYTLRWVDTQLCEPFWVKQRQLNDFTDLVNLVLAATQVVICHIRFLFYCHHRHSRVDLWWQRQFDRNFRTDFARALTANTHALFNISWSKVFVQAYYILAVLFECNNILGLCGAWVHDLRASANLEGMLLFHHLLVHFQVP